MLQEMGRFFVFEGLDGSGKTTQLEMLKKYLPEIGYKNFVITREPGGTTIGEQLRSVVHDMRNQIMLPYTELLIYSAARAQLVGEKILTSLDLGVSVFSDRYADSTLAYQGYGRGLDPMEIAALRRIATRGLEPDTVILFNVNPKTGVERSGSGNREWNRMDAQTMEFYERVAAGYLEIARAKSKNWRIIDANRGIDEVFEDVKKIVIGYLGLKNV